MLKPLIRKLPVNIRIPEIIIGSDNIPNIDPFIFYSDFIQIRTDDGGRK